MRGTICGNTVVALAATLLERNLCRYRRFCRRLRGTLTKCRLPACARAMTASAACPSFDPEEWLVFARFVAALREGWT